MRKGAVAGAIAVIWASAVAVSLLLAAKTASGPVVLVISRREGHGVHLGDIAAVTVTGAWALLATVGLLRLARRRRH